MREETIKQLHEEAKKDFSYPLNESGDYRDTWRIFRIMSEFVEGYSFLSSLNKEVTILGSARFSQDHKYYKIAQELGRLLGKDGYSVITGGGPGIMEAANRGAKDVGAPSIGLNIQLPFEQRVNPYVTKSTAFKYFFTRKVMLTSPAQAFVFFPGGFGTMDEFFEVVNNMAVGKMCRVPIVLLGKEYWQPLVDFLQQQCAQMGTVKQAHIDQWIIVDTAQAAYDAIQEAGEVDKTCEISPKTFHKGSTDIDWRVFRIMAELVEGFEFLTGLVEDVTVLGTRHMSSDSEYYDSAYRLGHALAQDGYAVVTGGAAGIAEAANKGAIEAGGESYGIGMEVRGKMDMNHYVTKSITFKFPFTRKLIVTAPSKAFVFYPGGLGTLHHLFEVLTLQQTGKMQKVPILLYDREYWQPLHTFIKQIFTHELETIGDEDDEIYQIVDREALILHLIDTSRGNSHDHGVDRPIDSAAVTAANKQE